MSKSMRQELRTSDPILRPFATVGVSVQIILNLSYGKEIDNRSNVPTKVPGVGVHA